MGNKLAFFPAFAVLLVTMNPSAWPRLILFVAALLFAACATAPQPRRSTGSVESRSGDESAVASPMRERSGLATGWGEERDSSTSLTNFVRASSRPTATETLYYNDREGVEGMLASEGGSRRRLRGMASAADGLISLGLRDGSGRTLDGFVAGGRRFVVGNRGERYEIAVRNETDSRMEVVLSVDGLDVLDGRPASVAKRGYIVAPNDTLTVAGFRTSTDTVAAFRFSTVSRSYAALSEGDTRNVGVIGVAVFADQSPRVWQHRENSRRRDADPFPGRWAQPPR